MTTSNSANAAAVRPSSEASVRTAPAGVATALIIGLLLLFGVGFAAPQALHNAAHDTRHVVGFPCH